MARQYLNYIKNQIEEAGLDKAEHNIKAEEVCEMLGLDVDTTIYALMMLFLRENKRAINLKNQNSRVIRRNDMLEESLDTAYKGNGRLRQMALVQSGMPIANKKKKSLAELSFRMELGETDKEIMEAYGISRTTLWRWKKELEEEEQRLKRMTERNSKWW
uniref:helix-turn-helix domain-containing protein n=1 Tax=Acetatifactor sp. TaxID=1872090 RepID=UPI004056723B